MMVPIPNETIEACRLAIADPTLVDPAEMERCLVDLLYWVDDHLETIARLRAEALKLV